MDLFIRNSVTDETKPISFDKEVTKELLIEKISGEFELEEEFFNIDPEVRIESLVFGDEITISIDLPLFYKKQLEDNNTMNYMWIETLWNVNTDIEIKSLILQCNPTLIYSTPPLMPRKVHGVRGKLSFYKHRMAAMKRETDRCNEIHSIRYTTYQFGQGRRFSLLKSFYLRNDTNMVDLIIKCLYKLETEKDAKDYIKKECDY